jgi:hypothetical protein
VRGAIAVVLIGLAGCRCGGEKAVPPPPPSKDAAVVAPVQTPITDAESTKAIGCILDRASTTREVLTVLAETLAPPPLIRRTIDVALARAKEDGESPVAHVLADAVDAYLESNDRDALVATFGAIDALGDTNSLLFNGHGPQRTRAGLAIEKKDFAGDELAITRERALAGDKAGAARFYDDVASKSDSARLDERVGALVAIDRIADAKKVIESAKDEDRLKLAGAWLDVALRRPGPLDEALQVILAELAKAPERALMWWGDRAAFRRAARLGRGRELGPLYKALKARYEKELTNPRLEIMHELAMVVGDTEDVRVLEKEAALAERIASRSGPIEAALARAKAQKMRPADYTKIWLRATTQPVPPGFGATLIATVCPADLGPPKPAAPPLAGAKLVAKEKSRGMRQECELHDVIVTLTDGRGKKLGTETIVGECTGACTAAEQREGQMRLDEIQKRIDEGEASQSETDYNFTDCMFRGPDGAEAKEIAGRQLVLIPIHGIGPHDVPNTSYQIALEVCGALHLLDSFGEMYAHHWQPADLTFRESADKSQIIVDGKSSFWNGVVARIHLPDECPGNPEIETLQTE